MMMQDEILIEKYFREGLDNQEKDIFKERLKTPEFKEQFLIEKQLFESFNENNWSLAENVNESTVDEYQELFESEDIVNLKETLQDINAQNSEPSSMSFNWKPYLYAAAAVFIFLIGIKGFMGSEPNGPELYATYLDKTEVTYSITRSDEEATPVDKCRSLFLNENYKDALEVIDKNINIAGDDLPEMYIIKGISLTELNSFDEALTVFDQLIASDFLDSQKGYWYKGLTYLKMEDYKNASKTFKEIQDRDFYNSQQAAEILNSLD